MKSLMHALQWAAVAAGLALAASTAAGAPPRDPCADAPQARDACRREAAAAAAEARRGTLGDGSAAAYRANALRRCDPLPAADREACIARLTGHGTTSGSVQGGGIYREYHQIVAPTDVPPAASQPR